MSQLYFSICTVGGVKGREKYIWSFPGTFTLMHEFQIRLVCSKLPIRVLLVYDDILQYLFGFGLYTPQVGTSRVQKYQKKNSLLLNTQVTGWKLQLWPLFR